MLETEIEMDEEGMTVPYQPLFDSIRRNHGFVDLRGQPELVANIMESSESPAMKRLLVRLARPEAKIFSVGCDVGKKFVADEDPPCHTAGGYIQIMDVDYVQRSPQDYERYAEVVAKILERGSDGHEWHVNFVLTSVKFKLDDFSDMTGSLWIWFHAFSDTEERAVKSREALIAELGQCLIDERNLSLLEALAD